jgi:hypothetical protein
VGIFYCLDECCDGNVNLSLIILIRFIHVVNIVYTCLLFESYLVPILDIVLNKNDSFYRI